MLGANGPGSVSRAVKLLHRERFIMKTRTTCFIAVILPIILWACGSFAYRQGYAKGARDEFAYWKKDPIPLDSSWDGTLIGRRDAWALPGGKKVPVSIVFPAHHWGVNNIPSKALP